MFLVYFPRSHVQLNPVNTRVSLFSKHLNFCYALFSKQCLPQLWIGMWSNLTIVTPYSILCLLWRQQNLIRIVIIGDPLGLHFSIPSHDPRIINNVITYSSWCVPLVFDNEGIYMHIVYESKAKIKLLWNVFLNPESRPQFWIVKRAISHPVTLQMVFTCWIFCQIR